MEVALNKRNDGDDASIASTSSSYWTSLPDTKVIQLVQPVTEAWHAFYGHGVARVGLTEGDWTELKLVRKANIKKIIINIGLDFLVLYW